MSMIAGTMTRQAVAHEVGAGIKASRRAHALSQATVARRAGMDPTYLSRIETGRVHPTVGTALRIAQAMDVSLDELVAAPPPERLARPCPVSSDGACLLEAVDSDSGLRIEPRSKVGGGRQLKLLRRVAEVSRTASPAVLTALGTLLDLILERQLAAEEADEKP